jgi:hypothetical protein
MTQAEQPQIQMIRQSLHNAIFQAYNQLIQMILTLPIPPNSGQVNKGVAHLEDGIIWIEKAIIVQPIELKKTDENGEQPEQEPEVAADAVPEPSTDCVS